jgi:hypothetical protein
MNLLVSQERQTYSFSYIMSRSKKNAPLIKSNQFNAPLSSLKTSSQEAAFNQINHDLLSALKKWEQVSTSAPAIAADEKRLLEMQKLLQELQKKIKDLGL